MTNIVLTNVYYRINQLQSILVQRTFAGEDSLNCYVLTAKLLMSLNSKEPYPSDTKLPFTLEEYWNQLVVQFSEKRALSVTESVLPLLGALLAQVNLYKMFCPSLIHIKANFSIIRFFVKLLIQIGCNNVLLPGVVTLRNIVKKISHYLFVKQL